MRPVPRPDRLSALDAAFLDLETPAAPLHVGWTLCFEGRPPNLAALRRHVDARLDALPRFRRRVVRPRLGMGDPHWADDGSFDVARHVSAMTLAPPAGDGELRALAGTLLSRPLDPVRPLWQLVLVDGLAGGGFALVGQAHHALVDGIAAVEVAQLLFDGAGPATASRWTPARPPSPAESAGAAAGLRAGGLLRGARAAARALTAASPRALRTSTGMLAEARDALSGLVAPAPQTALDRTAGPARLVAYADEPFDDVRAAAHRHGATVNDALLAAAALALRSALRRRGERPHALKALVPVNVRGDGAPSLGNRISFIAADLPVSDDDPVAVLRLIRSQTRARKEAGHAGPLDAIARAADLLPDGGRRAVARVIAVAASFNAVISNVPGPPVPLTLLGRRLSAIFPAVPFLDGHALSICAISYNGRLQCGLYADAAVVPDAVDVARDLEAAFAALRAAPPRPRPPWQGRARTRRDLRLAREVTPTP